MAGANGLAGFGVIGLGVMGANLAQNVEGRGFSVAVWNLEPDVTDAFVAKTKGRQFVGTKTLEEFVQKLESPRRILLMITAGKPVDATLDKLKPLLARGDIVIDGGNSWFEDTRRREADYRAAGLHFVGMGVSGGEEGARHGPSLMPGGTKDAWTRLEPVLTAIAAKTESGPCVTHVGPDGAGHFVKMVHNGIEYGDMQLIAETYDVLRRGVGMSVDAIADTFASWNAGPLQSFLVEITAKVLRVKDPATKQPLVDLILDQAGQKGTGKWTAKVALDLGVAVPTIAAAVDARVLSGLKDERVAAAAKLRGPTKKASGDVAKWVAAAQDALLLGRIAAYAQGMSLIRAGSEAFQWNIDLAEMARIWTGGCIIRSQLLDVIRGAFASRKKPANLVMARDVARAAKKAQRGLRKVLQFTTGAGIATPALAASLAWFDSYRTAVLPQNLTQAQRDAFGAHTYERIDQPGKGPFHTDWSK
ncbi:MAG: NADP-dependent phosphogluconate dehydrogenase [Planctomycetes bacterium]|nr:NADP-dependent phosphogluconate dehydrogenase [Planctomycetota bacterium]